MSVFEALGSKIMSSRWTAASTLRAGASKAQQIRMSFVPIFGAYEIEMNYRAGGKPDEQLLVRDRDREQPEAESRYERSDGAVRRALEAPQIEGLRDHLGKRDGTNTDGNRNGETRHARFDAASTRAVP